MANEKTIITKVKRYCCNQGTAALGASVFDLLRNYLNIHVWRRKLMMKDGYIGPRSIIRGFPYINIGKNFYAKDMLWLDAVSYYRSQVFSPNLCVGDDVSISRNVHIACINSVLISDGCLIGSNVLVTDHQHGMRDPDINVPPSVRPLVSKAPVVIGRNVWIGDGVVVLAGSVIGDGAIVAANSVVRSNIPGGCVVAGTPAEVVRRL